MRPKARKRYVINECPSCRTLISNRAVQPHTQAKTERNPAHQRRFEKFRPLSDDRGGPRSGLVSVVCSTAGNAPKETASRVVTRAGAQKVCVRTKTAAPLSSITLDSRLTRSYTPHAPFICAAVP